MTRRLSILFIALTLLATFDLFGAAAAPLPATSELLIDTQPGNRLRFQVELAVTLEEQEQGLMFRESLAPDAGMLFVFDSPVWVGFWMKDTLVPLDIIFIGADQRIVNIAANTKPLSLELLFSAAPVIGALEINAGLSETLGISPGDLVIHPALSIGLEPIQISEPATLLLFSAIFIFAILVSARNSRRSSWVSGLTLTHISLG